MFLTGKTALVTGSTSGIGLAVARALAAQGAEVVMTGFGEEDDIEAIRADLERTSQARAHYVEADLLSRAGTEALVEGALSVAGRIDILMNNAGMQHVSPVETFPVDKWDAIVAVNLTAVFDACRLVVPGMKERGWGRIINTASMHSLVASPYKVAYNATKHAVAGLTKTLALELAQSGITVNAISPGYVWTPLVENQIPDTMKARGLSREEVINDVLLAPQPTKKFVQPEEIGELVLFLCKDAASNMTGSNISIDGGWTAQ